MALGTPVAGAAAYSAQGGTTVAPAYPAGILATDAVLLFVGMKPSTANGGTVTTPTGWTLRDSLTGAGGYGTTLGIDTGNTNLYAYSWNTPVAGQTGTLSVTIGTNNVSWAFIVRIPSNGGALSYGSADGQRTTQPTSPMSIALTDGATTTAFQTGDRAIWAMCIPTDVTTPAQFSAQSITATGATFGTATELNEPDSGTGNDIGGYSAWAAVTAGSSTTAPTVTTTVGGTLTNVRGPVVLVRVREAAPPARTGTLAATETGADTFAATGDVHVKGSLAAAETGADTFAATGSVAAAAITGTLAATEAGADTFAATGRVIVRGALAASETGADTFAATGKVIVRGSLAATETGADTFAAIGRVRVFGALSASETGADTFAALGGVRVRGTLAATESGSDTFAAAGRVLVRGALAATEAGADAFSAAGKVLVRGALAATETGTDSLAATGRVRVAGSLAVTESPDAFSAAGRVRVAGAFAVTEAGADVFAGSGGAVTQGAFAATETGADALVSSGAVRISGALAATEVGADSLSAAGRVLVSGSLASTEAQDTFAGNGGAVSAGALAAVETGADVLAAVGRVRVAGALSASETGSDALAAAGRVLVQGSAAATEEGQDTFAGSGGQVVQGTLAATEAGADAFAATGAVTSVPRTGTMAAIERADFFGAQYISDTYFEPGYFERGVSGTVTGAGTQPGVRDLDVHVLVPVQMMPAPPEWLRLIQNWRDEVHYSTGALRLASATTCEAELDTPAQAPAVKKAKPKPVPRRLRTASSIGRFHVASLTRSHADIEVRDVRVASDVALGVRGESICAVELRPALALRFSRLGVSSYTMAHAELDVASVIFKRNARTVETLLNAGLM